MSLSYYLNLILTFALLGGLLFFLYKANGFLYKKRYSGDIELLDRKAIDQQTVIYIIRVRDTDYVLGGRGKELSILDQSKALST